MSATARQGLRETLDARAQVMYEAEAGWKEFAEAFTRLELEMLAELCQITPEGGGRSYDDEVFDALAMVTS